MGTGIVQMSKVTGQVQVYTGAREVQANTGADVVQVYKISIVDYGYRRTTGE
jgi:hypothetical protein